MSPSELSHINENNQPMMVDVSGKGVSHRTARARSVVILPENVMALIVDGELNGPKGPVFQTAIIAGTMACKKTSELIPFCHPLAIEDCKVTIAVNGPDEILIDCTASVHHKTGVEMEALTGATVAALTVYDMCKALSHDIVIKETRLEEKRGGKNDFSRED